MTIYKAVFSGEISNVFRLIESGVDPKEKDEDGRSGIDGAIDNEAAELIPFLQKLGMDVDSQNKYMDTALHRSVGLRYYKGVVKLCECGANVNSKNRDGNTALHRAAFFNALDIAGILIKQNASTRIRNNRYKTARGLAWEEAHKEVEQFLAKHGACL